MESCGLSFFPVTSFLLNFILTQLWPSKFLQKQIPSMTSFQGLISSDWGNESLNEKQPIFNHIWSKITVSLNLYFMPIEVTVLLRFFIQLKKQKLNLSSNFQLFKPIKTGNRIWDGKYYVSISITKLLNKKQWVVLIFSCSSTAPVFL